MSKQIIGKFLQFPLALIQKTSLHTAAVYAALNDLIQIAVSKNQVDALGVNYICSKVSEIAEMLNISKSTVSKSMNELENLSLILRKRRGCGQSNAIYVFSLESIELSPIPFVKVDKYLLAEYKDMNLGAKILYGICAGVDSSCLARAYAAKLLNVSERTVSNYFAELKTAGLIVKVRRGMNVCDKLFVNPIIELVESSSSKVQAYLLERDAIVATDYNARCNARC